MSDVVVIESPVTDVVSFEVPTATVTVTTVLGETGPQGPPGVSPGVELVQATPLATWNFAHTLGRKPTVTVYVGGELVDTDVIATSSSVTLTFAAPQAGSVVLS